MTKEYVHMRRALMLLFLFAVGVSMIVNGCGTLLQVMP
jgi:small neutral amino acid transporter SnatA (MarC family)